MNLLLCTLFAALGLAQPEPYTLSATNLPTLVLKGDLRPFVHKAAEDVARDFEQVFGVEPRIRTAHEVVPGENAIILEKAGEGFENYTLLSCPSNVLRITGSDDRGVMFGLYRFSRDYLGTDPFAYWSGLTPPKVTETIWVQGIALTQGDPSFKYRGWFINDEDFLNGFKASENGHRQINYERYHVCFGPALADKIYETAVRAGFNMMVCASYVDILNPDEKRLLEVASSRGLYLTMHHQEPVGAGALQLDLHFPEMTNTTYASHPDLWRKAWKAYIHEWAQFPDVIWQIGLRGRKDRPFWSIFKPGVGWADWGEENETEDKRRADLIAQAMNDQLGMIREEMNGRPFQTATQLWMEGADFYHRGLLKIPEETLVIFSDNCPGLKFQPDIGKVEALPTDHRYGLYYHLAVVCGNHHCELVSPRRTQEVLGDAYQKGAKDLILINVSNIRPFLYTLAGASEMMWNLQGFDPDAFQHQWVTREFGSKSANKLCTAFTDYFDSYEWEYSRDGTSSYGSPLERAPIPILNDGNMLEAIQKLLAALKAPPQKAKPTRNPDRLMDVGDSQFMRVNQDMFPFLADLTRYEVRGHRQAENFRSVVRLAEKASKNLAPAEKQRLYERLIYPASFLAEASDCCAELGAALKAYQNGDSAGKAEHLKAALAFARARDALDVRYNSGKWQHWYDRNIIYPYPRLTSWLEATQKP